MSHQTKLFVLLTCGALSSIFAGKHAKNGHWGVAGAFAWFSLYDLILVMQNVFTEGA